MLDACQGILFKEELEHLIMLRNQAQPSTSKRTYTDEDIFTRYDSFWAFLNKDQILAKREGTHRP
jgi:hypothetical protein